MTMLVTLCFCVALTIGAEEKPEPDVYILNTREIMIPLLVEPAKRPEIAKIILYVSSDQGKSWNEAAQVTPDKKEFQFNAPADGIYWFAVRTVLTDGTADPGGRLQPGKKIRISTVEKPLTQTSLKPALVPQDQNKAQETTSSPALEKEMRELRERVQELEKRSRSSNAERSVTIVDLALIAVGYVKSARTHRSIQGQRTAANDLASARAVSSLAVKLTSHRPCLSPSTIQCGSTAVL